MSSIHLKPDKQDVYQRAHYHNRFAIFVMMCGSGLLMPQTPSPVVDGAWQTRGINKQSPDIAGGVHVGKARRLRGPKSFTDEHVQCAKLNTRDLLGEIEQMIDNPKDVCSVENDCSNWNEFPRAFT